MSTATSVYPDQTRQVHKERDYLVPSQLLLQLDLALTLYPIQYRSEVEISGSVDIAVAGCSQQRQCGALAGPGGPGANTLNTTPYLEIRRLL